MTPQAADSAIAPGLALRIMPGRSTAFRVALIGTGDADAEILSAHDSPAEALADVLAELHKRLDHEPRRKGSEGVFGEHLAAVPLIKCADGLTMSVQASAYHYCSPRESVGPWYAVEVGLPSRRVAEFHDFAEDPERPTETVYGWVPIEKVADAIFNAGGFAPATGDAA